MCSCKCTYLGNIKKKKNQYIVEIKQHNPVHQRGEKKSHKKNLRYLETNENEKIKKNKKKKRK